MIRNHLKGGHVMRKTLGWMGMLAVALAPLGARAEEAGPGGAADQAEARMDAQAESLMGLARQAFQAGDYAAARKLALAVTGLKPGHREAGELHRLSVEYGLRVDALRDSGRMRRGESTEEAVERLSGNRRVAWAVAPEGTRARAPEPVPDPEKAPWQVELEKRMSAKGTVGFKDTPFTQVKEYFESQFGASIVVDRSVRERIMSLPVSFSATGMPLDQAFRWVVENDLGMKFALVDGAIFVSDAEGITRKIGVTRIYDVEDILYLHRMPDFEGPSLDPRDSMGACAAGVQFDRPEEAKAAKRGVSPERLMDIIKRSVEAGTWTEE